MSNIIENNNSHKINSVMSSEFIDIYNKIFKHINKKRENLSKTYNNNLLINFEDVNQLHHRTIQTIKSYDSMEIIVDITIFHVGGEKNSFDNFESFSHHNKTNANPTSEIVITYIFSVQKNKNIEKYTITNKIKSKISLYKKYKNEIPKYLINMIYNNIDTVEINIEYDDYIKARSFLSNIDDWVSGCAESNNNSFIKFCKKHSNYIPRLGRIIIYAILAYIAYNSIEENNINNVFALKFLIIYASIFIIISDLSKIILRELEIMIDSHITLSYINLNKGDEKLISEFEVYDKNIYYIIISYIFMTLVPKIISYIIFKN